MFRSKTAAKGKTAKVKAQNRSCFTAILSGESRTHLAHKLCAIFLQKKFRYANQNIQGNVLLSEDIWKTSVTF